MATKEEFKKLPTKKEYKNLLEYVELTYRDIAEHRLNTELHLKVKKRNSL
jgi:hypothetical protein